MHTAGNSVISFRPLVKGNEDSGNKIGERAVKKAKGLGSRMDPRVFSKSGVNISRSLTRSFLAFYA